PSRLGDPLGLGSASRLIRTRGSLGATAGVGLMSGLLGPARLLGATSIFGRTARLFRRLRRERGPPGVRGSALGVRDASRFGCASRLLRRAQGFLRGARGLRRTLGVGGALLFRDQLRFT